jgi:hypothetical protein
MNNMKVVFSKIEFLYLCGLVATSEPFHRMVDFTMRREIE